MAQGAAGFRGSASLYRRSVKEGNPCAGPASAATRSAEVGKCPAKRYNIPVETTGAQPAGETEQGVAMRRRAWRSLRVAYLVYVLAFPLAMGLVVRRPLAGPTICLFRLATHLDCPSCGLTRAFRATGRLDVAGAFRYNPLGPVFFVVAVIAWGYFLAMLATDGRLRLPAWWRCWRRRIFWAVFAVYLLLGLIRIGYELWHPQPPPPAARTHLGWPGYSA